MARNLLFLFCGVALLLTGIQASPVGEEDEPPVVVDPEVSQEDEEIMALFDNIDDVPEEEDEFEGESETGEETDATPDVRRGNNRRGQGRGRGRGQGRGQGRGHGRGGARNRNAGQRLACPLMRESVEKMPAFAHSCFKEHKRVKMMIRKSKKNKNKPCTHACCNVAAGKKCCPTVNAIGNCTLIIKDGVSLGLAMNRRGQGARGQGQGQGRRPGRGQGRGQGRRQGNGQTGSPPPPTESSCPARQPFLRQLVACGAQKARLLFVKGIPSALNPKLLCRSNVDCAEDEICCSSVENRCDRSCSKK